MSKGVRSCETYRRLFYANSHPRNKLHCTDTIYIQFTRRSTCLLWLNCDRDHLFPRIPASRCCAFARSFSLTSTPSTIRTFAHARMISPRYASRPTYDSFGKSRRNLLSSSCQLPPSPRFPRSPPPSDGCSAPGTSLTRSGRYHPSVHGFILHQCISTNIQQRPESSIFLSHQKTTHYDIPTPRSHSSLMKKKKQKIPTYLKSSISTSGIR